MKRLSVEQEQIILNQCIKDNQCDEIVEQYWKLIINTVRKTFIRKNAPLAQEEIEDVCQDVFVRLFDRERKRLRQYEDAPGRTLVRWLIMVATHTTLDYLNKKGFDSLSGLKDKDELIEETVHDVETEKEIINKLLLIAAIEKLPQSDLVVFKLWSKGFSSKEIGKIMGMTAGSVDNKISKIRNKLRELLGE